MAFGGERRGFRAIGQKVLYAVTVSFVSSRTQMSGRVEAPADRSTRRKRIVGLLDELDTPVTVDQLVDELQAVEGPEGPDTATWEQLHERLHDEDLPTLDRAGLLVFDDEQGLVTNCGREIPRMGRRTETAPPTNGSDDADDDPVTRAFAGLGILALGALAAVAADVGPLAAVPLATVSTAFVIVFSLLALGAGLRG